MSLIELLIAVIVLGILMVAAGQATGAFTATADASKDRSDRAVARAALDARVAEIARTAPELGDLTVVGATTLSFRKRQAPSAAVCSYASPTVQLRIPSAELANLRVGDSVAIRDNRGTPDQTDDSWDLGVIQAVTQTGVCDGLPTIAVTLNPAPTTGVLAYGATARVWSTRTFAIQAAPPTEVGSLAGSLLMETINGASSTRAFGPFVTGPIFTYLDGSGNPASSASTIRLVRATFIPIAQRQRQAVPLRAEHLEWPIGSATVNLVATAGSVTVPAGTSTAAARCNTPGATNYGSQTASCAFPPPVIVASVTPNPVTTGTTVSFNLSGSYDVGGNPINQYQWVIGSTTYSQSTVTLSLNPGNVCWTAQVTNVRNLVNSQSGCVAVYAKPTVSASVTRSVVTIGQTTTLSCTANGQGRSVVAYQWMIDGGNASSQSVSTTPSSAGNHTYQCRAETDLGAWSDWTTSAFFTAYAVPTAAATVSPAAVTTGQTITYDPRASSGSGRSLVACTWTISGVTYNNCAVGTLPAPGAGNDCWTLQVENDLNAWSSIISGCTVVYARPSAVPSANVGTQNVGQSVTVSAAGSTGQGRSIVAYTWTGAVSSTAASVAVPCTTPGSYTATLTVENDLGAWSDPSAVSFTCQSPPTARVSAPASVIERTTAIYNGSTSSTPGGQIVAWNWWIEGVNYTGNYPTVQRILNTPGPVSYQLQVQNQWGTWSNWTTGTVTVAINPCPYNSAISVYSATCVPPCPIAGAPAGMTASDPACTNTPNAIAWDTGTQWQVTDYQGSYTYVTCTAVSGLAFGCAAVARGGTGIEGGADLTVSVGGAAVITTGTKTDCVTHVAYAIPVKCTTTAQTGSVATYHAFFMEPSELEYGSGTFTVTLPATVGAVGTITASGDWESPVVSQTGPTNGVLRFHAVHTW